MSLYFLEQYYVETTLPNQDENGKGDYDYHRRRWEKCEDRLLETNTQLFHHNTTLTDCYSTLNDLRQKSNHFVNNTFYDFEKLNEELYTCTQKSNEMQSDLDKCWTSPRICPPQKNCSTAIADVRREFDECFHMLHRISSNCQKWKSDINEDY